MDRSKKRYCSNHPHIVHVLHFWESLPYPPFERQAEKKAGVAMCFGIKAASEELLAGPRCAEAINLSALGNNGLPKGSRQAAFSPLRSGPEFSTIS